MRIRFIKAPDTYALRHRVLRPHQTIEDVQFPNDRNPDSFHLGTYIGEHLIGVASFYRERHEELMGWKQYRLRGMATHPDLQGQGVGKRMLRFALEHLRAQQADLLWCNAREGAAAFYERLGFRIHGPLFDIPGVGPHYIMHIRP